MILVIPILQVRKLRLWSLGNVPRAAGNRGKWSGAGAEKKDEATSRGWAAGPRGPGGDAEEALRGPVQTLPRLTVLRPQAYWEDSGLPSARGPGPGILWHRGLESRG